MFISDNWKDYELIDASDGERLERWGEYILIRPDPQVIWHGAKSSPLWKRADASYKRSSKGGGAWQESRVPESWTIGYRDLTFLIKPMGFKHTGIFPEQAANWDWITEKIKGANRPVKVLNLFAYTGGATVAAAAAGAAVCHVDAARGMVAQAKENARLSGLGDAPIRYIVDDCKKFVEREIRRGNTYDGIIMDPPSYGRGPSGEVWKIEECVDEFVTLAAKLLSDKPIFFLINSYTTGLSPLAMQYIADLRIRPIHGGHGMSAETVLPVSTAGTFLPAGASMHYAFD